MIETVTSQPLSIVHDHDTYVSVYAIRYTKSHSRTMRFARSVVTLVTQTMHEIIFFLNAAVMCACISAINK